jgi:hypothetical protein
MARNAVVTKTSDMFAAVKYQASLEDWPTQHKTWYFTYIHKLIEADFTCMVHISKNKVEISKQLNIAYYILFTLCKIAGLETTLPAYLQGNKEKSQKSQKSKEAQVL